MIHNKHYTPIAHRLIGAYRYDTWRHLCLYAPCRRRHGVVRGQPPTDPSPGTIPHIWSPSPVLVVSCPPPFRFTEESLFFFSPSWRSTMRCSRDGKNQANKKDFLNSPDRPDKFLRYHQVYHCWVSMMVGKNKLDSWVKNQKHEYDVVWHKLSWVHGSVPFVNSTQLIAKILVLNSRTWVLIGIRGPPV